MTAFAWMREKLAAAQRALPKRQQREPEQYDPGRAPLLWCVLLTLVGVAALIGSTWMLLVFVAGSVGQVDWASSYVATEEGVTENTWHFQASIHWLVGVGLFLFCAAIAIFNATWLEARKHMSGMVKQVVTAIGVLVAVFMISGAIVVQQRGTDARDRDRVVEAQTAQVGVVAAQDRLNALREDLERLQGDNSISSPSYQMQACRAGERGWAGYITQARSRGDGRLDQIERAMNSAQECDRLKAERDGLMAQVSVARVEAVAVTAAPVSAGFMHDFTTVLEDARKPVTATLGELLAMTAFGFALASWRTRRAAAQMPAVSVDEAHMIADMREDEPVAPEPMRPAKRRARDGETGDPLTFVEGHWRRTTEPKRAKPRMRKDKDGVEVEAPAGVIRLNGDEIGLAAAAAGVVMAPSVASAPAQSERDPGADEQQNADQTGGLGAGDAAHASEDDNRADDRANSVEKNPEHTPLPTTPALTDEDLFPEIAAKFAAPVADAAHTLANGEGVIVEEPEQYGPPAPVRQLEEA